MVIFSKYMKKIVWIIIYVNGSKKMNNVFKFLENFEILVVEDILFLWKLVVVMLWRLGVVMYEVFNG